MEGKDTDWRRLQKSSSNPAKYNTKNEYKYG